MRLLVVLLGLAIVAVILWTVRSFILSALVLSATMAVSMFCVFCLVAFIRSCFGKYEGLTYLWITLCLGLVWFLLGYHCNHVLVAIGSMLGVIVITCALCSPEKKNQHQLQ